MCSGCDWEQWVDDMDDLLSDPDYEFAEDTIAGIKEWVEANEHITSKQTTAIDNIRECKS